MPIAPRISQPGSTWWSNRFRNETKRLEGLRTFPLFWKTSLIQGSIRAMSGAAIPAVTMAVPTLMKLTRSMLLQSAIGIGYEAVRVLYASSPPDEPTVVNKRSKTTTEFVAKSGLAGSISVPVTSWIGTPGRPPTLSHVRRGLGSSPFSLLGHFWTIYPKSKHQEHWFGRAFQPFFFVVPLSGIFLEKKAPATGSWPAEVFVAVIFRVGSIHGLSPLLPTTTLCR